MPGNDDRREFYDKELWPQLNPAKFLIDRAQKAQKEGKLEDAILYLETALSINPDNQRAREKVREIQTLRINRLAQDFVERFYPSEAKSFDSAWLIYNFIQAIQSEEVAQALLSKWLGISKLDVSKLHTPKIIIFFNTLFRDRPETLSHKRIKEVIIKTGRAIGCDQDLINKVITFFLER